MWTYFLTDTIDYMIQNSLSLIDIIKKRQDGHYDEAICSIISFFEKQFNAKINIDASKIPYGRDDLIPLFAIAKKLIDGNIITGYSPSSGFNDEPLKYNWSARCAIEGNHSAGGMSAVSDEEALVSTLAEAVERFLWYKAIDFLKKPRHLSISEMEKITKNFIDPLDVVGFTEDQRRAHKNIDITPESKFWWTKGYSWTSKKDIYLPAQLASSCNNDLLRHEKRIFIPITTGLATWPTYEGAILSGALEIIERDAFMITWLNQLTLPQLNLSELAKKSNNLAKLIESCHRYGLEVSATRLLSDAPTYAVCASVKDARGHIPEMTIGLKAGNNLANNVEGALLEALRMRISVRNRRKKTGEWDDTMDVKTINHMDRVLYWAEPKYVPAMYFLAGTPNSDSLPKEVWDEDTKEEHLPRLIEWAQSKGYEMASVSLGASKKNVSPWKVEMVVMPDLQPMHQNERFPYHGGTRLQEIPKLFGYSAKKEYPIIPHPFA